MLKHATLLLADYLDQIDAIDDAEERAEALIEWFNRRTVLPVDLDRLIKVGINGFQFWKCPLCEDLVCEGAKAIAKAKLSWGDFQGARENDRVSYPGIGPRDRRCDFCRCHNVGE